MATYVYGITRPGSAAPDLEGVGGRVRVLAWEQLAAAVSDVEADGELPATARGLKAHARVLEALATEATVLPLRFGTVVDDDAAVVDRVLRPRAEALETLLERFSGLVEVNVRVLDQDEVLLREVAAADATVQALQRKVARVGPTAGYYDRIRLGEHVAELLRRRHAREVEDVVAALRPLVVDVRVKEPSLQGLVVDAALLVERDRLAEVDDAVDAVARARPELTVRYLGPNPPYTFTAGEL